MSISEHRLSSAKRYLERALAWSDKEESKTVRGRRCLISLIACANRALRANDPE